MNERNFWFLVYLQLQQILPTVSNRCEFHLLHIFLKTCYCLFNFCSLMSMKCYNTVAFIQSFKNFSLASGPHSTLSCEFFWHLSSVQRILVLCDILIPLNYFMSISHISSQIALLEGRTYLLLLTVQCLAKHLAQIDCFRPEVKTSKLNLLNQNCIHFW